MITNYYFVSFGFTFKLVSDFIGNIDKCRQITQPTLMKDVKWATYTCPIGFEALGIWPEGADGTDINAIDRFLQDKQLIRKNHVLFKIMKIFISYNFF